MDNKSLSHTKWNCQYHIIFIPKYRKKSLYGQVRADVREIIQTLCKYKGVEIIEGAVCIDHVHLCVSIPPKMSIFSVNRHAAYHQKMVKLWNRSAFVPENSCNK